MDVNVVDRHSTNKAIILDPIFKTMHNDVINQRGRLKLIVPIRLKPVGLVGLVDHILHSRFPAGKLLRVGELYPDQLEIHSGERGCTTKPRRGRSRRQRRRQMESSTNICTKNAKNEILRYH
jgi:hypothetical protein